MKKLLVEKFITYHRVREQEVMARIKRDDRLTPEEMAQNVGFLRTYSAIYISAVERARKYRIAASGESMIEALRPRPLLLADYDLTILGQLAEGTLQLDPDIPTPIERLPDTPIWLELETPFFTGGDEHGENQEIAAILFFSSDHEVDFKLKSPQPAVIQSVLEHVARSPAQDYQWTIYFVDREGRPRDLYFYLENAATWNVRVGKPCPADSCTYSKAGMELGGKKIEVRHPCPFCATILAYWRSWVATALLTVTGQLAATESGEWPQTTERGTRKVQRPGSGRYDEIQVAHDYYLVSFDASVKKKRPPAEGQDERETEVRGSWVAAAREIDPNSVVYLRQDFGQSERHLDPAHNPRWRKEQIVKVRGHERRLPMRVRTAQKKITRVLASKYASGDA